MSEVDAVVSLQRLCDFMQRYYKKDVIILLDEYDTPVQETYLNGYWDEIVAFIRNLFNCTFKTNPYLGRAIMAGITRVSKEVKLIMEKLLNGESFHTKIDEQIVFSRLDYNEYAIWSLLLAGGYLKVESYMIDGDTGKKGI